MFKGIIREDADAAFDLIEGEEILHITHRHEVLLVLRMILPVFLVLLFAGLVFYRAVGGGFLVPNAVEAPQLLEPVNLVLTLSLAGVALMWLFSLVRTPKQRSTRQWLIGVTAFLGALLFFRTQGGRVFFIDPLGGTLFDPFNTLFIILCIISVIAGIYTFIDWANDELILTNKRVIRDDDFVLIPKLLERRVQDLLAIDDIQNVVTKTENYPQHWLNYGTVTIQSAVPGKNIIFKNARNPKLMQEKIDAEVKKAQKRQGEQNYAMLVESHVYDNKPVKSKRESSFSRVESPFLLRLIVPENPTFDPDKEMYIWHPHWIFLIGMIARPIGALVLSMLVLLIAVQLEQLSMLMSVLLVVFPITPFFVFWFWWEVEDHRNDLYILTPTNVIDREKKPLGPEERRTASIGALQNVSYETTFISNLLGYGDVLLETAGGGGKFTFLRVPQPRDVVTTINDYLAEFRKGEKERTLKDALALLKHYHDAQIRHSELSSGDRNGEAYAAEGDTEKLPHNA